MAAAVPSWSPYLKGAACGLAAASIWASWSAFTRVAVTTGLDGWDIAALRFGVAGLVLSPVLLRRGLARDRVGWTGLSVMIAGAGAPYALLAATGLRFAPAGDQGALNPGCVPLFVAPIAAVVLRDALSTGQKVGLGLMLAGVAVIVGKSAAAWDAWRGLGHLLVLTAALFWAAFTVAMHRARIEALHAAALVSTGSLLLYLPIYVAVRWPPFAHLTPMQLAFQAPFQGLLVTVVSLVLYGRAVEALGATRGAAFGALVPALSAVFAIPLLGEWPSPNGWAAIILISAGVYLASGGRLPRIAADRMVSAAKDYIRPAQTSGAIDGLDPRRCGECRMDLRRAVLRARRRS